MTTTRLVPIADLVLEHKFWTNPRIFTGLDEADLAELGRDQKERGTLVPPKVQKIKGTNGVVIDLVIDGQRRVLSGRGVFPKGHKIEVIDRTEQPVDLTRELADEIMLEALSMGQKRKSLSSYELSEVAMRMRDRDKTLIDIANAIDKSESWVSKILKARTSASAKLMLEWRKGNITDEQFKDLAAVKDQEQQTTKVDDVKEARASGDKAEARTRAKEAKAVAQKPGKKPPADDVSFSRAKGPAPQQVDMFKEEPAAPKKKPMTARVVLEQMLDLSDKRPPVHDYVRGIMAGVAYALDDSAIETFGKPWAQYISRIEGGPAKGKPAKNAAAPRKSGGKARRGKAAKPAKPTKKAARKKSR